MVNRSLVNAILLGGLIAAFVDVGAASVIYGARPDIILRAIAGGVLGPGSQDVGTSATVLGFVLQELMGIIIAAIFVVASLKLTWMRRRWTLSGVAYGVVVFGVMNFVVVPLSALHRFPKMQPKLAFDFLAMLLFGLIIAWFAKRMRQPGLEKSPLSF